ncbi:ABC transporter permease [Chitinophaga tropicalis]|uniref:FtsX-like permease family protein n=1 Tax=Chitinophaga tropicalis TaxID=2683588 RepID=A0A7K1U6K8_9BACT|nr:ABC transporter permease [Chitinophaga tropicalis]MVT09980.1 FtsX-like permease family protein [Chitinophaga tropicalis]
MLSNYLKSAGRILWRNKMTTFISLAGLTTGIACFLLLATYILNELRYDRFHEKAGRIVFSTFHYKSANDPEAVNASETPTALVPTFKRELVEVEDGVRVYNLSYKNVLVKHGDRSFNEKKVLLADRSFFNIFTFRFLSGNSAIALNDPNSVVITSSTAKKYFGEEAPLGKTLTLNNKAWQVTGVIEDVPPYSQLKFDLLGSYSSLERSKEEIWHSANDLSYFLLKPGADRSIVQDKINSYVAERFKEVIGTGNKVWFELEPLTKVHLYSQAASGGNIKYIYILGSVAILLLLIACINFTNLMTAKSLERTQEIGVRKALGAVRRQLFWQFMIESALVTFLAMIAGILLSGVLLPYFNYFTGMELSLRSWNGWWLSVILAGLLLVITFVAGAWPAVVLAATRPVSSLYKRSGNITLRKVLVVFQFTVSIAFIIATIIAKRQLHFIKTKDTGLQRSQLIVLDKGGMEYDRLAYLKSELLQQPGVTGVTASYDSPVNVQGGYSLGAEDKPADFSLSVTAIPIEKDFVSVMGVNIAEGGNFTESDVQQVLLKGEERHYTFMLNETAAKAMGWNPAQAVGKRVNLNGRKGTIKAVLKDFNFVSLHHTIAPIVVFPEYDYLGKIFIKTSVADARPAIAGIEKKWKEVYPDQPFEYHFLDQEYNALYRSEQRTTDVLNIFSIVTIVVSCLGLFGLAVFIAQQRTKEIGIRKILGASVAGITLLISKDFMKLVGIAVVVASPLAWYAMHRWLQDFAYRTAISWWMFLVAGVIALLIALVSVSYQAVKAAMINPVKSLRMD